MCKLGIRVLELRSHASHMLHISCGLVVTVFVYLLFELLLFVRVEFTFAVQHQARQ